MDHRWASLADGGRPVLGAVEQVGLHLEHAVLRELILALSLTQGALLTANVTDWTPQVADVEILPADMLRLVLNLILKSAIFAQKCWILSPLLRQRRLPRLPRIATRQRLVPSIWAPQSVRLVVVTCWEHLIRALRGDADYSLRQHLSVLVLHI